MNSAETNLADLDRRIVLASQAGLPLDARPYHWLAKELGVGPELVMERMRAMLSDGRVRRIGVVPNHYRLGYSANGMSVWDVPDGDIQEIGRQVGDLDIVSHCYQRPRHLPRWPYNLFAMAPENYSAGFFCFAKNRCTIPWSPLRSDGHNRNLTVPKPCRFLHPNLIFQLCSLRSRGRTKLR